LIECGEVGHIDHDTVGALVGMGQVVATPEPPGPRIAEVEVDALAEGPQRPAQQRQSMHPPAPGPDADPAVGNLGDDGRYVSAAVT
jgi:hypothetical protein